MILETLDSVREPEPVDVVVIDDATPDQDVVDKLRGYEQSGLISRLILCTENGGASRAVNIGVEATDSPYVCTFANDDLLIPGALAEMADALDSDPGASFVVGDFEYFGARTGVRRSAAWDPWRAMGRNAWPGSLMIRREVFLALGGLTSECLAQDWDLYLGLAAGGHRGIVLPKTVYRYRIHEHGNRLSSAARKGYREEARTVRRRHASLFARERELRRASDAGIAEKLFWTLMIRLAPHRPPIVTNLFFLAGAARTRITDAFSSRRQARQTSSGGSDPSSSA
jgi:glycosyltransferase involved in cell wall biosynthesis